MIKICEGITKNGRCSRKIKNNNKFCFQHEKINYDIIVDDAYVLKPISLHQQNIIDNMENNLITLVNAVAGAGKTTLILYIAKQFLNKKILVLMYNKMLKYETRQKAKKFGLNNIEIHSYHGIFSKHFHLSKTDEEIRMKQNAKPKSKISYDIIIVDEYQDVCKLYIKILIKLLDNNYEKLDNLLFIGDKYQDIYGFKKFSTKTDVRYFDFIVEILKNNVILKDKVWSSKEINYHVGKLPVSYRITDEMAKFINYCFPIDKKFEYRQIKGNKPEYYIINVFQTDCILHEIINYINEGGKNDDIAVLAGSVNVNNKSTPIKILANKLSAENIDIFYSDNEQKEITDDDIKNKIVFTTVHQFKGRERKFVVVFGFDDSSIEYNCIKKGKLDFSDEIKKQYVAVTRASERLILLQDEKHKPLRFLKIDRNFQDLVDVKSFKKMSLNNEYDKPKCCITKKETVTNMLRFIPPETLTECCEMIEIKTILDKNKLIDIQTKIDDESVSDITSLVIIFYAFYNKTQYIEVYDQINDIINKNDNIFDDVKNRNYFVNKLNELRSNKFNLSSLTKLATLYLCLTNNLIYRAKQIKHYDWISYDKLKETNARICAQINNPNIKHMEFKINHSVICDSKLKRDEYINNYNNIISFEHNEKIINIKDLTGIIDYVDKANKILWEFKCVKKIEDEHLIQVMFYKYLFEQCFPNSEYKYCIFNILTNELYELNTKSAEQIVKTVIISKLSIDDVSTDIFLQENYNLNNEDLI